MSDGHVGTVAAASGEPNTFGLHHTVGNVWEWCADRFGPYAAGDDPQGPARGSERVMRGRSYLCHDSYCRRCRVAARTSNTPDSSAGNVGFRCAIDCTARADRRNLTS